MRHHVLLAVAVVTMSACGGSRRATAPTTVVITLPPTTAGSSAPSHTPSSAAPTSPATTAATTSTTLDPRAEAERLARDAVDRFEAAFAACIQDIAACDTRVFDDVASGTVLARTVEYVQRAARESQVVRDADNHRYVVETVTPGATPDQLTVTSCNFDGRRLVRPNAAPDGSDIVVDDSANSTRYANDVRRGIDGRWRIADAIKVGVEVKGDQCAAH